MRPLLPNSYVEFKDGQLPRGPLPSGIFVFIGCGKGEAPFNTLIPISSPNEIAKLFGHGSLARDLTTFFLEGAGFAYAIQLEEDSGGVTGGPGALTPGQFTGMTITEGLSSEYGEWQIRGRITVGGDLGVAQVKYSLDNGRTWGPSQVLRASNRIIGPGNFRTNAYFSATTKTYVRDVTPDSQHSSDDFSFSSTAPLPDRDDIISAIESVVQDPSIFVNGFHISYRGDTNNGNSDVLGLVFDVASALQTAEQQWFKYLYAIIQNSIGIDTSAEALTFATTLRNQVQNPRVQVVNMNAIVKSMGGQLNMNLSPVICARRAMLKPQNDLGMVAAGQLLTVMDFAPGWNTSGVIGVDQLQNTVTIRKHVGAAGFYPTNGWMTDPSSDYSADKFRLVADLVAADVRTIGVRFVKIDIDPSDVEASIQPLLDACKGPCDSRVRSKQASAISLSVPPNQNILVDKEVVVEVSIIPMGSADWIRFSVGFQSPIVGG